MAEPDPSASARPGGPPDGEPRAPGPADAARPAAGPASPAGEAAPPAGEGAPPSSPAREAAPTSSVGGAAPPLNPHLGMLDREAPGRPAGLGAGPDAGRDRSRAGLIAISAVAVLPGLAVLVAVLFSLASGPPGEEAGVAPDQDLTRRYCTYSAPSQGAYDRCLQTADPRVLRRQDGNAARFARSDLLRCLADAGPLCVTR